MILKSIVFVVGGGKHNAKQYNDDWEINIVLIYHIWYSYFNIILREMLLQLYLKNSLIFVDHLEALEICISNIIW